jgi:ATP-dependent DNA ligase
MGLEGMVSKHRERAYRGGRCGHWVKVKAAHAGYTAKIGAGRGGGTAVHLCHVSLDPNQRIAGNL